MPPRVQKLLEDLRGSAEFILEQASHISAHAYRENRVVRQAIERNFEIIGEAMNRLHKLDPTIAARISHTQQIISFRNVLIHGYDLIDDQRVLEVISGSLPQLLYEVKQLIEGQKEGD